MRSMGNGSWSVSKKRKKCKKFFVTVMGDVACHYIIKWLDSNHHDNQPAENPGSTIPWVFVCVREDTVFVLPTGIIAYVIYKNRYSAHVSNGRGTEVYFPKVAGWTEKRRSNCLKIFRSVLRFGEDFPDSILVLHIL